MAPGNTPYSADRYGMSHELNLGNLAAGADNAADEVIGRHRFFTSVKVLEARAIVNVVGTDTDSAFTVYKGTDSIGSIAIGTETAGTVVDASLDDTSFDSTDDLSITQAGATDTGAATVVLQYQERFA